MTDPITCPQCGGSKVERIGKLAMACKFCHGAGTVGGDYEPAEGGHQRSDGYRNPLPGETYDPAVHGPLPAAQDHPAMRTLTVCRSCFGSKEVIKRTGGNFSKAPCPDCA